MTSVFRSAAYRIAFAASLLFALAIAVLGSAVYRAADAEFRRQQDEAIVQESDDLVAQHNSEGRKELLQALARRERGRTTNGFGYALVASDGRRLAGAFESAVPPPGWHDIFSGGSKDGDPARALVVALADGSRLIVSADTDAVEQLDETIVRLFLGAFAVVVLLGVVGAILLGGYIRMRLGRIGRTAEAVVGGAFDRRAPVGSANDEFDQLALALNAMLDRIEMLMNNLRQVSSDVAHDLRTPLARMRSRLEEAVDGSADADALRAALTDAIERNDELLALFSAILRISEVEAGALERTFGAVDLSTLAAEICETYRPALADSGRKLGASLEPDIVVRGDRELIAQAMVNLIDNAQAHTPVGTTVTVVLSQSPAGPSLSVADNGPGVATSDHDSIVRRFVRLDSSRTTRGHGLGLNLVSAIAAAHGAHLTISDNEPGLRVMMTFPKDTR